MVDMGRRQPAFNESFHSVLPVDSSVLAPPFKDSVPVRAHGKAEVGQGITITRYSVVANMPAHDRSQPRAYLWNRVMHALPQFGFDLLQLRLPAFTDGVPYHRKPPLLGRPADMRESQKVESLRFPLATPLLVVRRMASKLQQSCLLRVQFQAELCHSFL